MSKKSGTPPAASSKKELTWEEKANVAESRRRDSQAELTPALQKVARLEAENSELRSKQQTPMPALSEAEVERLDTLLDQDPNAWRKEINRIEAEAHKKQEEEMSTRVEAKAAETLTAQEKEANWEIATQFFEVNTDLDSETFPRLVPVGLQEDLKAGKITMQEFLDSGSAAIRNATVATATAPNSPNLGAIAGSPAPTVQARQDQSNTDWKKTQI